MNSTLTHSRRAFLKRSALAIGMVPLLNACGRATSSPVSSLDPDAINNFKKSFSGNILIPGDSDYDRARRALVFNPEMNKFPSLVARCKNQDDVIRCLDLAHKYSLEVAVRSGNHSFLGWGTSEKGIVVDLSGLKTINVNAEKQSATVGAGSQAVEILGATAPAGLTAVLGQCGTVGAGISLGGGLGWLAGKHGASSDNVLAATVITADGKVLRADATNNTDLFWAIRGGGGNFGIVTEFEYKLHPLTEVVAGRLIYSGAAGREAFKIFKNTMAEAPDELQADCFIISDGKPIVIIEFVYSGNLDKGDEIINKIRSYKKPDVDEIMRRPFSQIYNMYKKNPGGGSTFSSVRGAYIQEISEGAFDVVVDRLKEVPSGSQAFFNFSHYEHGEVCRVSPDATAFELRKANAAHLVAIINWNEESNATACLEWHTKTMALLRRFSGDRIYTNYMSDPTGGGGKVFGKNYEKLLELKKKYDPENFFHLNQNIDPNAV